MALIEREAAKAKKVYCVERHEYVVPVAELDWMPTIDAVPVVHGRWVDPEDDGGYTSWYCSLCGHPVGTIGGSPNWKYCPHCGARMDGGEGLIDAEGKPALDNLPTIDPIHAAGGCYCRECRRCNGFPSPEIEQNEVGICKLTGFAVEPDGWCRWSKLREVQDDA